MCVKDQHDATDVVEGKAFPNSRILLNNQRNKIGIGCKVEEGSRSLRFWTVAGRGGLGHEEI